MKDFWRSVVDDPCRPLTLEDLEKVFEINIQRMNEPPYYVVTEQELRVLGFIK